MFLLAIGYGLATWRSVIKPKPENHLHWYDRVLRAIGALMFVAIFVIRWRKAYGPMVRQLERDLPELLSVFAFPAHLRKKLRTTNVIERCFVEVRRRTRPMVCFVNVESVDRILYSIFHRFNLEWKTRTLSVFTQAA